MRSCNHSRGPGFLPALGSHRKSLSLSVFPCKEIYFAAQTAYAFTVASSGALAEL